MAFHAVRNMIFKSRKKDQFSAYHTSNSTRFSICHSSSV